MGLEWCADVRCSQHRNPAHWKAMGLCYSIACTWEFNTWFMSLSNKSSTGKAVFQILSISWVENRSGLTTFSPHLYSASTQRELTPSCFLPSHAQLAPWENHPLVTHTKGSLPFPSLAFLWRQWILKRLPSGSSRMNKGWPAFIYVCGKTYEQDSIFCQLTRQHIQMQFENEATETYFQGLVFCLKMKFESIRDILHLLCTGDYQLRNCYFNICVWAIRPINKCISNLFYVWGGIVMQWMVWSGCYFQYP